jgi:hypothetical protein
MHGAHAGRWVQAECRRLGDADAPEVDPLLQRAAAALRERPVLYKYCAEEVATARHNALFQRCAASPALFLNMYLCEGCPQEPRGCHATVTACNGC